jgi:hypothetical protein
MIPGATVDYIYYGKIKPHNERSNWIYCVIVRQLNYFRKATDCDKFRHSAINCRTNRRSGPRAGEEPGGRKGTVWQAQARVRTVHYDDERLAGKAIRLRGGEADRNHGSPKGMRYSAPGVIFKENHDIGLKEYYPKVEALMDDQTRISIFVPTPSGRGGTDSRILRRAAASCSDRLRLRESTAMPAASRRGSSIELIPVTFSSIPIIYRASRGKAIDGKPRSAP